MTVAQVEVPVVLGFTPPTVVITDDDGLLRAGTRGGPYSDDTVVPHECTATDLAASGAPAPDLFRSGFDLADLSGLADLQATLERVRVAGRIEDDDATVVRSTLNGATLPLAAGRTVSVLHVADEGLIMRSGGPNGRSVVGARMKGMNGHAAARSVHADQDVHGTPLTQVMDGRAPTLFRYHAPDGDNDEAALMLVNLWIPLQQVVQPLVLGDGTSLDRARHQLRYGLPTTSFLTRDGDMVVNDIWLFLHDPAQRWCFRSDLDARHAWLFDTLSTPHSAGILPGEDAAERYYDALEDAEAAVGAGDAAALAEALVPLTDVAEPFGAPPGLRAAIAAMASVADEARLDPAGTCGQNAAAWTATAQEARRRVVRLSIELRLVVAVDGR